MILNSLRIASWNIDGCFFRVSGSRLNKLDNDNVLEMIHKVDIAFLVETHCLSTDSLAIKDFDIIQNNRKKHKYAKKGSGGIAVCIRSSIRNGIKILPFTNSEFIWIKLSKVFFNFDTDIYVCGVYIAPQGSSYSDRNDDLYPVLEQEINVGEVSSIFTFSRRFAKKS